MLAFWPDVIEPLLSLLEPRSIVEIGSESGKTTKRLLELGRSGGGGGGGGGGGDAYCGATVHCVDPEVGFDPVAVQQHYGPRLVLHPQKSLDALPAIERMDAVLIDGDHNWYTVYHELQMIERQARDKGQALPLILMHDVTWPYGRRDLYYQPETIPEAHRQPYARGGLSPLASGLLPKGGYNATLRHALHEGGPKNGVRTALEDYLADTEEAWRCVIIPAIFGLAILLPETLATHHLALAEQVAIWAPKPLGTFIDRLETARIAMLSGSLPKPTTSEP